MKRKRFSVEQIVAVLKQAEHRASVADLVRKVDLTEDCRIEHQKKLASIMRKRTRSKESNPLANSL